MTNFQYNVLMMEFSKWIFILFTLSQVRTENGYDPKTQDDYDPKSVIQKLKEKNKVLQSRANALNIELHEKYTEIETLKDQALVYQQHSKYSKKNIESLVDVVSRLHERVKVLRSGSKNECEKLKTPLNFLRTQSNQLEENEKEISLLKIQISDLTMNIQKNCATSNLNSEISPNESTDNLKMEIRRLSKKIRFLLTKLLRSLHR